MRSTPKGSARESRAARSGEGKMAAQLIAAHSAVMECYRRAMIDEEPFRRERDETPRHANRLSRTFVLLQGALQRYRARSRPAAQAPQDAGREPEQKSTKQHPAHKAAPPPAPAAERPAAERPAVPAETGRTQNSQKNPRRNPRPASAGRRRCRTAAAGCDRIRVYDPVLRSPGRVTENLRNNPTQL
jgi:hypothetical protein